MLKGPADKVDEEVNGSPVFLPSAVCDGAWHSTARGVNELIGQFNDLSKDPVNSVKKEFFPAHGYALDTLDCEEAPSGNGLVCMSLRGFIQRYGGELEGYYDEDLGAGEMVDDVVGDSMILLTIDHLEALEPPNLGIANSNCHKHVSTICRSLNVDDSHRAINFAAISVHT